MIAPTADRLATALDGVRPPLVRREQRRRRVLLVALAALIILSISPVLGHHLIGAVRWFPADLQRIGIFCIVQLHQVLGPVHAFAHILLYAGVAYAIIDRVRAVRAHRRVLAALDMRLPAAGTAMYVAAQRVGLAPEHLRLVDGMPNPAFTTGWLRPCVYVTADLSERLSSLELEAVLAHEGAHAARRDPLRFFILRFLSGVLFWLPALRRLTEDLADEAEIEADDVAARTHALPLASAILKMAGGSLSETVPDAAIGFQRADLLERRIRRLAGEDATVGTHVSWQALVGAAAVLVLVWASGVIVLHPLPPPADGRLMQTRCASSSETSGTRRECPRRVHYPPISSGSASETV